jgi:hypothetical protein
MNNLNSEYIINQVSMLNKDLPKLSKQDIDTKYSEFKQKYPKIWEGIFLGVFTLEKFENLIEVHNKSYSCTKGDHLQKKFQSDKNVGEILAREYLYPVFGYPPDGDLTNATQLAGAKQFAKQS